MTIEMNDCLTYYTLLYIIMQVKIKLLQRLEYIIRKQ